MSKNLLVHIFIFLSSAALVIPLMSRFKLGSVLGYLIIGITIGPFGFNVVGNADQIMQFAEFGVVMMLFLIGLELEPAKLWRLRHILMGLGSLQVTLTTLIFTFIGCLLGYAWQESLAVSMGLALSSTALVLQMLQEKKLLQTVEGQTTFAVLLFQDIAVIGILIILPLLALPSAITNHPINHIPELLHVLLVVGVIGVIMPLGHYFSDHLFYAIARTNLREIFTATSLALLIGIVLLMKTIGASPALGAFITGVLLANSAYKKILETDLEPFKGLLLGLFFISVGMSMNFNLIAAYPMLVFLTVLVVLLVKSTVLIVLGRIFKLSPVQTIGFAFSLSQVGEFAFVLFHFASNINVLSEPTANFFIVIVALSMVMTPFLMMAYHRFVIPRYFSLLKPNNFEQITEQHPIILAGYGRFGQIIGRFLRAQNIEMTILEKDPQQIESLRKFGFKGFFGDATRLDILKNAGADKADILIIAIDDAEGAIQIAALAKRYFPRLKIYARARNRRHAFELHKMGVHYFKRETFESSLIMAHDVLIGLGQSKESVRRKTKIFAEFDEAFLIESFEYFEKEAELISFSEQASGELERILQEDRLMDKPRA